ncbi:MAG: ectoine hydroxylase-related dioxygenase (phytanoyl-CoA dioxygenase family) [Candidatus Poriferisodalaceae bacterium]|jgi:ectoine hydroxylase-related dioxygenase (phytanoyl-CoA dioxygenase family)
MLPTSVQIETFRRKGFVVIPDVFSAEELLRYGAAVDQAVAKRTVGDTRAVAEKSLYEQSFIQCMNLWETDPAVRELTFDQELGELGAALLGASALRIWHDQALYKEAGGRETDAHQDQPFWPITPADQITAWIPFDGSTRQSGAMSYLPGSHAIGLRRFVDITHTTEPYDVLADDAVVGIEPILVEAPRGSVVFHHSLTVHQAHANNTDATRRVYCIICFADGCTRSKPWPHVTVERQNIAVGEPIKGDVSPIVWPRPNGELPPTPASTPPQLGYQG